MAVLITWVFSSRGSSGGMSIPPTEEVFPGLSELLTNQVRVTHKFPSFRTKHGERVMGLYPPRDEPEVRIAQIIPNTQLPSREGMTSLPDNFEVDSVPVGVRPLNPIPGSLENMFTQGVIRNWGIH